MGKVPFRGDSATAEVGATWLVPLELCEGLLHGAGTQTSGARVLLGCCSTLREWDEVATLHKCCCGESQRFLPHSCCVSLVPSRPHRAEARLELSVQPVRYQADRHLGLLEKAAVLLWPPAAPSQAS